MSAIASYLRRVLAFSAFMGIMSVLPIHATAPEYKIAYLVVSEVPLSDGAIAPIPRPTEPAEPVEKSEPVAQPSVPENVPKAASSTIELSDTALKSVGGQSPTTHVVREGETLSGIAAKYRMSTEQLAALNGLTNLNMIRPGQTLLLAEKPPEPRKHTVRSGENLSSIAASYGVTVASIVQVNELADIDRLKVGQVLNIPSVAKPSLASRSAVSTTGMIWPVLGRISSYFGPRWGTRHTGLDIAAPTGTDIRAVRAGRVEMAGWWGGYGNCVIVDHGNGLKTLYAHASRLLVRQGDRVVQGQVIARVGSTGNSTGPHVHFEVRVNNRFMDPLKYMPK